MAFPAQERDCRDRDLPGTSAPPALVPHAGVKAPSSPCPVPQGCPAMGSVPPPAHRERGDTVSITPGGSGQEGRAAPPPPSPGWELARLLAGETEARGGGFGDAAATAML